MVAKLDRPEQKNGTAVAPPSLDDGSIEELLDYLDARIASTRPPRRRAPRERTSKERPFAEAAAWFEDIESQAFEAPFGEHRFRDLDEIYKKLQRGRWRSSPDIPLRLPEFRRAIWQAVERGALQAGLQTAAGYYVDDVREADGLLAEAEAIAGVISEVEPEWWAWIAEAPTAVSWDRQQRLSSDLSAKALRLRETAEAFRQSLKDLRSDYEEMSKKDRGRPIDRLSRGVVWHLNIVWKLSTGGRRACIGDTTTFEDFAEVVWRTVGVPCPNDESLSSWLGELIKEGAWRKNPIGEPDI